MNYKKTAAVVAGALLALGTGSSAHAAQADNLSTNDLGHLLGTTDDAVNTLRQGGLSRDDSLVKGGPKRTGLSLAGIPLGISTPN